jgi:hypothetical protein
VRIVAEEEQTFQSFGFEQDLVRHPLAFASQILDQPVDGLIKSRCDILSSRVASTYRRITAAKDLNSPVGYRFPAPCGRLFESAVLFEYQCRQPVFC